MYEVHWDLRTRPFENRFSEESYYPSEVHQAALLKLRYAIENRRSAAVLCGTSGMGKSLLLQALRLQLPEFVASMTQLVYPIMDASQFMKTISQRIVGDSKGDFLDSAVAMERLEERLTELARNGQHVVVAIDEAHLLEQYQLIEPVRLLLNLAGSESEGESAITLILCGQPTLLPHIQRNLSLEERIAVRCILNRFELEETMAYIAHRIRSAGGHAEKIFDQDSLQVIHDLTQGIPRRINRLCDLALMVGYAQELDRISCSLIEDVQGELATPGLIADA